MRLTTVVLFTFLSVPLISCTTAPLSNSKNEIPQHVENLKSIYEKGFNKIMADVPALSTESKELNNQLMIQIRVLKDYSMKWGYIDETGMLRALETASSETKAWFAIHQSLQGKSVPPYAVTPGIQPIAIRI